jgi:hypothetical protein
MVSVQEWRPSGLRKEGQGMVSSCISQDESVKKGCYDQITLGNGVSQCYDLDIKIPKGSCVWRPKSWSPAIKRWLDLRVLTWLMGSSIDEFIDKWVFRRWAYLGLIGGSWSPRKCLWRVLDPFFTFSLCVLFVMRWVATSCHHDILPYRRSKQWVQSTLD